MEATMTVCSTPAACMVFELAPTRRSKARITSAPASLTRFEARGPLRDRRRSL